MDTILLTDESSNSELIEVENLKQHFEALEKDRAFIKLETKSKDKGLANQSALAELSDNPDEDAAKAYLPEENGVGDTRDKLLVSPTLSKARAAFLNDLKKPEVAGEYLRAILQLKLPKATAKALKNIAEANKVNFYSLSAE